MTTTLFSRYVIAAVFVATVASLPTTLHPSREWAAVVEEVTGLPGTANATTTSSPFPVRQRNVSDVRLGGSTTATGVAKKTPRIHGRRGGNGKKPTRNKHKKNEKQNRRNRNNKLGKRRISKVATNIIDTSEIRTLQPMVISSEATKEINEGTCTLANKQFEHTKFMQLLSTYVLLTMLVVFVTILIVFIIKDCTCNYS